MPLVPLLDVPEQAVDWLWPGRLARGQKNNLRARPSSLAFQVVGAEGDTQRIDWLGPVGWSDSDLLGVQVRRTQRQRACEFLSSFLAQGPQPRRAIVKAGRAAGLTINMLRGAARALRIEYRRVGNIHRHTSYWLLPGQEIPTHLVPPGAAELDAYFRKLEAHLERNPPIPPPLGDGGSAGEG
jgi:hypothetical protein